MAPARARGTITIALVSDRQMRALNRTYRHIDRATDVLSFPASAERDLSAPGSGLRAPGMQIRRKSSRSRQPVARSQEVGRHLGDLAISLDTARRQADEMRHSLQTELRVLALHGLLHLLGYDHERDRGEMARLERRLGRRRGLTHGLTERR
ncbi:MAG: rRNA maturation RNase YbeY [Acidobacteria bacterium]|nr:rRNA maturation RNase YbeY [Acidobacteriota bacterium]